MKKKLLSAILALSLCVTAAPPAYAQSGTLPADDPPPISAPASAIPTRQEVYDTLMAMKEQKKYQEGTPWTNDTPYSNGNLYHWKGGPLGGVNISAVGCVAFAFELSDAAFGELPARMFAAGNFSFSDVKPGDILRINNDAHTVIVLETSDNGVVIAEGNYNSSVHWGRTMSKADVEAANHYITRYPEGYIDPDDPSANETIASGPIGQLAWTLTNAGTLTVSGTGAIPDFDSPGDLPWSANGDKIRKIVVTNGITGIGKAVFYGSKALSAKIPGSVETIGPSAFYGASLISVSIPGSVKAIGNDAFNGCSNLSSINISNGVETIGERAFRSCTSLKSVTLPASVKQVGSGAFFQCTALVSAEFVPGGQQVQLGDNLFTECWYLTAVKLPEKADRIGEGMFQNCKILSSVSIPEGAESIGGSAFASCSWLTSVTIPGSVKSIGIAAFSATALKDVYYGGSEAQWASVQKIGDTAAALAKAVIHYNTDIGPSPDPDPGPSPDPDPGPSPDPDPGPSPDPDPDPSPDPDPGPSPDPDPGPSPDPTPDPDPDPTPDHTHAWSEAWSSSDMYHWHECTAPGCTVTANSEKAGYAVHFYDDSQDTTCNICGYIRTITIIVPPQTYDPPSTSHPPVTPNPEPDPTPPSASTPDSPGTSDSAAASVTTGPAGQVIAEAVLPASLVSEAQRSGNAVKLPLSGIRPAQGTANAPAVTVKTGTAVPVKVEIPVENVTPGTVAVLVSADGSEIIQKSTTPTASGITVYLSDGATVKIIDNSKAFTDIAAGHWAKDAVDFVSARELFSGTSAGEFSPDSLMTRGMLVTVLARYSGEDTEGGSIWYEKSLKWAAANGISDGSDPDGSITREQLAAILWRYAGTPASNASLTAFTDADGTSGYARTAMSWAVEQGIINGFEDGRLSPGGYATRAEVAAILMRYSTK